MHTYKEEKISQRKGLILSIAIHVVLALLFLFIFAWTPPNPPPPQYGIEIALGTDREGQGEQPDFSDNTQADQEANTENVETKTEEVIEEVPDNTESDVPVKTNDTPKVPENQPSKNTEKPKEPSIHPGSQMPSNKGNGKGEEGTTGNKGKENGEIDGRSVMGNGGSGGNSAFSMEGWKLNCHIKVNDTSNESGKIVFEIRVDADGYLAGVTVLQSNISPSVRNLYKKAIENQIEGCLEQKGSTVPPMAVGTYTVILKSR